MKITLKTAFIGALVIHLGIFLVLVLNVSLDKPEKPEHNENNLIHATVVTPPAKGSPDAGKKAPAPAPQPMRPPEATPEFAQQKTEELKQNVEAQRQKELERQNAALALKRKKEEERKKAEEAKKLAEKKKKEEAKKREEARKLAEKKKKEAEEKKKQELKKQAEKKKQEELARKKAEEQKKIAEQKKKAEEARKLAEQKKKEDAQKKAAAQSAANSLEDEILGKVDGSAAGKGLGAGSSTSQAYGSKIEGLILQNWIIDPSMDGKQVVVTFNVDSGGNISNANCTGDGAVCRSAIETLKKIGMMPMPPRGCSDCNSIVLNMTPKI